MKSSKIIFLSVCLLLSAGAQARKTRLENGFVYLRDIDPRIIQDMRYAGYHNFVGRPIKGYETNECILTKQAARALKKIQNEIAHSKLSLKVYDCYRPERAVQDFVDWSHNTSQTMKNEFYPNVNKSDAFREGYIARRSGHSRGSTVDLTLVRIPALHQPAYHPGEQLQPCYIRYDRRYQDNSVDMGTGYDCLDPLSHYDAKDISTAARAQRLLLRTIMIEFGFEPYENEWWHFTLKEEPFPDDYFDFPIQSPT